MTTSTKDHNLLPQTLEDVNKRIYLRMKDSYFIELLQAKTPASRADVLIRRGKLYAENGKQDLAFRDLKQALSLAPQNRNITDAIRGLQSMSLNETTEDPENLMSKFLGGDKSAGERIANNVSSESFVEKFFALGLFDRLLGKGKSVDG